jgi:hypothetical protein
VDARDPVGYGSAMAWTPADRSAMAVPGFPSQAGKQSYNAAISRQDRGAILGADSGIGDGDFRWTASADTEFVARNFLDSEGAVRVVRATTP